LVREDVGYAVRHIALVRCRARLSAVGGCERVFAASPLALKVALYPSMN
jgi:hypothetical protein